MAFQTLEAIAVDLFYQSGWSPVPPDAESPHAFTIELRGLADEWAIEYFTDKMQEARGATGQPAATVQQEGNRITVTDVNVEALRDAAEDISQRTIDYNPADAILSKRVRPIPSCSGFWERQVFTDENGERRGSINMNAHITFPPKSPEKTVRIVVLPGMYVGGDAIEGVNLSMEIPEQLLGGAMVQNNIVHKAEKEMPERDLEAGEYYSAASPDVLGGSRVRFFLSGYPDVKTNEKEFVNYLKPSIGPAEKPYSMYAKYVADEVFRPQLPDLSEEKDPVKRGKLVAGAAEQMQSIFLFSYSIGCVQQDYLERAVDHMLSSRAEGGLGWNPKEIDMLFDNIRFNAAADFSVNAWQRTDDGPHFNGLRVAFRDDAFVKAAAGEGLAASTADITYKDIIAQVMEAGTIKSDDFPEKANALIPLAGGRQMVYLATILQENFRLMVHTEEVPDGTVPIEKVVSERESKLSHGPAEYFGALISGSEGSMMVPMVQANYMGNIIKGQLAGRAVSTAEAVLKPCGALVPNNPEGNIRYMMLPMTAMPGIGYEEQLEANLSGWKGEPAPTVAETLKGSDKSTWLQFVSKGTGHAGHAGGSSPLGGGH